MFKKKFGIWNLSQGRWCYAINSYIIYSRYYMLTNNITEHRFEHEDINLVHEYFNYINTYYFDYYKIQEIN